MSRIGSLCPCPCLLYHAWCNCDDLATQNHHWQLQGVEGYRTVAFDIAYRALQGRSMNLSNLRGHFVRYFTYHECRVRCAPCVSRKWLTRCIIPGLFRGASELPAIRVVNAEDNTDFLCELTDANIHDIIVSGEVSHLHNRYETASRDCDCLEHFVSTDRRRRPPASCTVWLAHAHWQQVDVHHPGPISSALCYHNSYPPEVHPSVGSVPRRVVWVSKGWVRRDLTNKQISHQSTQTDAVGEVSSLRLSSLAAIIDHYEDPVIVPCVSVSEQDPLWVRRYRTDGDVTWSCSEYLPDRQHRALARYLQQRNRTEALTRSLRLRRRERRGRVTAANGTDVLS